MLGFLLVDKPQGRTSHDVVARLRRTLGGARVGHAGTLDPLATGLLVCAVGQATRLLGRLQLHDKAYDATMRLGVVTDTQDTTGAVLDSIDGVRIAESVIRLAAQGFLGRIDQAPPAYSAVKLGGVPMHRRIRRGMAYTPPPARAVTISQIAVTSVDGPDVHFHVECSSGTYIRTLCHDWGAKLDVGGCMAALRRTRSGPFAIADAQELDALHTVDAIAAALLPPGAGFPGLPRYRCSTDEVTAAKDGRVLPIDSYPVGGEVRLDLPSDEMFALAHSEERDGAIVLKAAPVLTEVIP